LALLEDLAANLRWSWHAPTRDLFAWLDPELWARVAHNPVAFVHSLSGDRLAELSSRADAVARIDAAAQDLRDYLAAPSWYDGLTTDRPASIAYFSPEYGIDATLPQYSGGLGILAGDHLKSASDLGVPIVGVGLLYGAGYFRQSLSHEGWQTESYPKIDPHHLPLTPLREADGAPVVVTLDLPGTRQLRAYVWRADVGRVPLLLLDSHVPENDPDVRSVTDRLYGGGGEQRLQQELLLGVGGMRALAAYSRLADAPVADVFHMNEGHAGFLGIERIRLYMEAGLTFAEALEAVRVATVFTTHTPVPAGIDRFPRDLVERYFSVPSWKVPVKQVMALGAETQADGDPGVFNMAFMGLRLGGRANGVSLLHGEVSRGMFGGLWPGFDAHEVPITSITNGVHAPTWTDPRMQELEHDRLGDNAAGWAGLSVTDDELWKLRRQLRTSLVEDARARVKTAWLERGASVAELSWIADALDPDVLTIGFARRVPTYKRLTLMLRNPERLKALLTHPERPVQLIIAGKAHPHDEQGKRLIQQLVRFADDPEVRHRIVFLPNYDIGMSQVLLPGCDVWLNNPLRPLEACGTSGMKAALNGGLNLSILDGWWDEWHDAKNGWAIPTADGIDDEDRRDDLEAEALYDLIESQVAPTFYDRNAQGVPQRWIERVRHTLATLGPKVQATRMVQDYTEKLYAPAFVGSRELLASDLGPAKQLASWKAKIRGAWPAVRLEHVESHGLGAGVTVGQNVTVQAYTALDGLALTDVAVQLLHGPVDGDGEVHRITVTPLALEESFEGGRHRFATTLKLEVPGPWGYAVRIVPHHPLLASDAELGLVAGS
jgi:starch phosphorylase